MRYRVEELAATCGVSVDTVRYYQSRRLLPPPERDGRVALYTKAHVDRINKIRSLQRQGLTLEVIDRLLAGRRGRTAGELARAVAEAQLETDEEEFLTLDELGVRAGVPAALLKSIEGEGLQIGRVIDNEVRYTTADVELVKRSLRLLELGIPLSELLALARDHHDAVQVTARRAVELFDEYVRRPIKEHTQDEDEAASKLVEAFRELLPSVTDIVAHHFRRVLLASAEEHIERVGDEAEVEATRRESRRRLETAWTHAE